MTRQPLFDPADFRIPEAVTYVCVGAKPPFLRRNEAAMTQYFADKSPGMPGRTKLEAQVAAARAGSARREDAPDTADRSQITRLGEIARGRGGMTAEEFFLYRVVGRAGAVPVAVMPRPR